jgi:hypothetical protein
MQKIVWIIHPRLRKERWKRNNFKSQIVIVVLKKIIYEVVKTILFFDSKTGFS